MTADLSGDDRGKTVVAGTERFGTVTDVRGGRAHVDTDVENAPEQLADAFGWTEIANEYTIDEDDVTTVPNSPVRLGDDRFRDA